MELYKSNYEKKRERERIAILQEARRVWPLKEWRSVTEYLNSVTFALRNKSYCRSRWGLIRLLTAEGIYRKTDGRPSIDFSGYDERVS